MNPSAQPQRCPFVGKQLHVHPNNLYYVHWKTKMKKLNTLVLGLLVAGVLVAFAGCAAKEEPAANTDATATTATAGETEK